MTNMAVLFPTYTGSWFERSSPGASPTALALDKQLATVKHHVQRRAIDWEEPVTAALQDIAQNCSVSNWDGQGAREVSMQTRSITLKLASTLSRLLTPGIPAPDLIPEPDGEISLSWDLAPGMVFSVSIGEARRLNYAGIIGRQTERHGGEPFNPGNTKSLKAIITTIEELFECYRAQFVRGT